MIRVSTNALRFEGGLHAVVGAMGMKMAGHPRIFHEYTNNAIHDSRIRGLFADGGRPFSEDSVTPSEHRGRRATWLSLS